MSGPRFLSLPGLPGRLTSALLALGVAFALWLAAPALARETAKADALPGTGVVSVEEAKNLLAHPPADLIILDVRTPQEFREGHLAGAQNLDFFGPGFERAAEALPRDAPLLLYCRSGRRSQAAAEALKKAGHLRVLHMEAGLAGWKKAGLPLTK